VKKTFLIKILSDKALLTLKNHQVIIKRQIASDKTFSENFLYTIDKIIKETKLQELPTFKVSCSQNASAISCNVAKATIKGLEQ
jgi:hypothetical protein